MNNQNKMVGGCGGNCACARANDEIVVSQETCKPEVAITLDKDGKCPCGKTIDDCCHKDEINTASN